ncbi:MAG: poly-gamma-glutamate synthase PgsB [Christensenellales bacterium]|jgi:poly-gamma-glutamate synthase PgsB/CapB
MVIAAVLLALLLSWGFWECACHRKYTAQVPMRILVNGTRGKTSVARLTAAALNEAGIRTYAKTTGSQARWIAPDGTETDYRGTRRPNLMEQLKFFRQAVQGGAHAVVVECMAIAAENQRVMAQHLVRPTHVLLTNAFVDHIDEIGNSVDITAQTLALSVPTGAQVFVGNDNFDHVLPQAVRARPFDDAHYLSSLQFATHPDNVALVLAFTHALGIDRDTALRGMRAARPDAGMAGPFTVGACQIINAFAVNDAASFARVMAPLLELQQPVHLLYNHRSDRAYRLNVFAAAVKNMPMASLAVMGEGTAQAARVFKKCTGRDVQVVHDPQGWIASLCQQPCHVVCFGNIKGAGLALVEHWMKEGTC